MQEKQSKLSFSDVTDLVDDEIYTNYGTVTTCTLVLVTGYKITAQTNVKHVKNFDPQKGEEVARNKALIKLVELESYARATRDNH